MKGIVERDKLLEELKSLKTHHHGVTTEQEQLLSQVILYIYIYIMMSLVMTSLLHSLMK